MNTQQLKKLRNALSCWQDDYDCDDDKEQYDMLGAAIDAISRLEVAERANSAQSDHINQQQDRIDSLEQKNAALGNALGTEDLERDELRAERDGAMESSLAVADAWVRRAKDAEAELARRDAAAGERVATHLVYSSVLPKFIGDTDEVESYSCFISGKTPPRKTMEEAYADAYQVCGPLYTAAPPAVLPPKLSMDIDPELQGEFRVHEAIRRKGFNQALDAALELGAQQQNFVELPMPFDVAINLTRTSGDIEYQYHESGENFDRDEIFSVLDAANVKWEVKK